MILLVEQIGIDRLNRVTELGNFKRLVLGADLTRRIHERVLEDNALLNIALVSTEPFDLGFQNQLAVLVQQVRSHTAKSPDRSCARITLDVTAERIDVADVNALV